MKSGYVAIIGQPNVGKSTLLNRLLGQKISITSRKPQTTRHRILGIKTTETAQALYVDTPGMHPDKRRALNRYLNKAADTALSGVDVVIWMIAAPQWREYDEIIANKLKTAAVPVILVINKLDKLKERELCLPFLASARERFPFAEMIPISALKGINLDRLENAIFALLPEGEPIYPEDQITDRHERFLAAEIIREKLTRRLGQELPHVLTVEIERYEESSAIAKIYAVIWVERAGQKSIVIGNKGAGLKQIGIEARQDIEKLLERKAHLELWVKVKEGWSDSEKSLQHLGYRE